MLNLMIWIRDKKKSFNNNSNIGEIFKNKKGRIRFGKKQRENKHKFKKKRGICKF
jgi:hypothetical protein